MWKLKNKLIHNFNLSKISLLKDGLWGYWTSSLTKAKHELYKERCGKNIWNFLSFFNKTCLHLVIEFHILQKLYVEKWYAYENPHGHAF
jgi:hypothetical protein